MSQQQVGQVYSKIIDQVCDASQIDFEEGGVDAETLKLLKQRWQKKLSALEVGHFPWEPQPQKSATSVNPSPTPPPPATSKSSNSTKGSQPAVPKVEHPSAAPQSNQGPRIKADPGYHPNGPSAMSYPLPPMQQLPPGTPNYVAQQRAAQELQRQYGPRAAVQVNQLQQSSSQHQQSGLPSFEDQEDEDRKPILPRFSPPVPPSRVPLQSAQQDGANDSLADWKAEVARRRTMAAGKSAAGEQLFRDYMVHRQQQIEGGGLMISLDERYTPSAGTKRRVEALFEAGDGSHQKPIQPAPSSLALVQADGQADEDEEDVKELDEDAINSDLDDPDDVGGDPEDETVEQVMLCTYDKVQRTKNKWKCFLKDGILRVGNKEYVFNKGQGEFEW